MVKNPPANVGGPGLIPGSGISSGREHGNPYNTLVWKVPTTEEPSRLQTMGLQRVGHN